MDETNINYDEILEELTLLMLYLTSFRDNRNLKGEDNLRAWKGYPFEFLNALDSKKFITQSRGAKSVVITDEGVEKAEKIKEKYMEFWKDY
jgi:hypothetical protein